jgi:L-aspartate oxidase
VPPEATEPELRADVAVVGGGLAGLYTALVAASEGARVALVSRSPLAQSASYWAQGGIAAAIGPDDSPGRHLADTLEAGRGTARESAARVLCEEAPARVRELERLGVRFDSDDGGLELGLEGGHSARRIVHAGGSATGAHLTRRLSELASAHERIEVLEGMAATSLWVDDQRCAGAVAEPAAGGRAVGVAAGATVLATGGAAALWERSTNPPGAVGVGLSLAHAAGVALADLELVQFHPTALVSPKRDGFLITEAVRGEGAVLLNAAGERFVDELAPRDEVALAIQAELRSGGPGSVKLDMRAIDRDRFPNISAALREAGIDPTRDLVPVAPAAHYTMGGIATDLDGRASLPGLYAVGECGCTGLHGANRLASNSLSECLVFGRRAALAATREPEPPYGGVAAPGSGPATAPPLETRRALWRLAGLERSAEGLELLARDAFPLARFVAAAALARAESRGAHRRSDRPDRDPALDGVHFVLRDGPAPAPERWS